MRKAICIITGAIFCVIALSCGDEKNIDASVLYDADAVANPYDLHFDSMPDGGRRLRTFFHGTYGRVFSDKNDRHLSAATAIGIDPITDINSAWEISRPMVKISTCREYFVDNLTHSIPYLIPEAAELLREIGQRFNDSLEARGGGHYRIKLTSVLRTPETVARLRKRNRNASKSSAHQYGTTFDIGYSKFICDSVNIPRTQADLKGLLGEILQDLRNDGRCYVKHERRQGCFHITTRK